MRKTGKRLAMALAVCLLASVGCQGAPDGESTSAEYTSEHGASGTDTGTDSETTPTWEDAAKVVDAEGLVPDDVSAAAQNLEKINGLIADAAAGTVIRLPAGSFFVAADRMMGGIRMLGKRQIALVGQDTQLVNASYDDTRYQVQSDYMLANVFTLSDCQDISIRGLTVRYRNPSALSGEVTGFDGERTLIRPLTGNTAAGGEYVYCVSLFSKENVPGNEWYLSETSPEDLVRLADGTYSFAGRYGAVGDRICLRFTSATYAAPLFNVMGVGGLTIADVTVSGNPSAVCIATGNNRDMTVERMRVVPPDDTEMLFASNQDAFHIKSMRGNLILRDCTFVGLGDDALNTHALMGRVEAVSDGTLTTTTPGTGTAMDAGWAQEGDKIDLYDGNLNLLGTARTVRNVQGRLTLDSVPDGVGEGTLLRNRSNAPDVVITGCHVERSRARAFLIQSDTAIIRDCTLRNIRLSGILVAPDTRSWYEMGPVQSLTVTGCTFERVGTVDGDHAAVCVRVCHDSIAQLGSSEPIHGSVTVTGNTFSGCRTAIFVRRAASATVQDNTYERCRYKEDIA